MALNYFDLNAVTIETRFAPWTHGHTIDNVTGLRDELDSRQSGLTSSSEIQFKTAEVFGDITPNSSAQYNLGSSTKHFKEAWIDEIHLSDNTLYLGDTPVIGTNASTVEVKADTDQGITVKTTGTGESKMISENGIEISNSGMNGQVVIQATGAGGQISFGAVDQINFTAPDANFGGNIDITGHAVFNTATFTNNVVFQGDNIQMDTTNFTAEDNRITLNSGEVGDGVTAGYAGFDIDRGNLVNWQFVFNESTDSFEYGAIGGTPNIVVSKAYVDGVDALKLNAVDYNAADVFAKVKTLDGTGSGLDADLLDGYEAAYFIKTAQDYMDAIQTIDGTGSGLDADLLDGHQASYFAPQSTTYTKTEVDGLIDNVIDSAPGALDTLNELAAALGDDANFSTTVTNQIATKLDSSAYTASDVLTKLKTVDGASSGLDADLLDGYEASYFSPSTHTHSATYLGLHAKADDSNLLDGLDSTKFARLDVTSTITAANGIKSQMYDARGSQLAITAGESAAKLTTSNIGNGEIIWLGAEGGIKVVSSPDNWSSDWSGRKESTLIDTNGNASFNNNVSAVSFTENGTTLSSKYLGISAKAADSNKLDGIDSSSFLRADSTDYMYNTIYTRGYLVAETGYRNRGIYGTYDNTKTQHIWSMGTSYQNAADGSDFGNLYGLAYKYNGSAGGHGVYLVNNGTAYCGMGTNLWTSGLVKGRATSANYADLAERYTVDSDTVEPGQVILIGSEESDCVLSNDIASQSVLGVVSTNPGLMMNAELVNGHYIALKGRVPCKVFGKVSKGEPLVSFKDGMAIGINHEFVKEKNIPGIIFGKALEASNESGVETIEVVVL